MHEYTYAVLNSLTQATERKHDAILQWVPGHAGIAGNELADSLAKSANKDAEIQLIPLTPMDTKHILKALNKELCISTWFNENTKESIFYEVDPQLKYQLDVKLSKSTETLIHQLTATLGQHTPNISYTAENELHPRLAPVATTMRMFNIFSSNFPDTRHMDGS